MQSGVHTLAKDNLDVSVGMGAVAILKDTVCWKYFQSLK